jgi:hypothetical protein
MVLFPKSKLQQWHDTLPENTRIWIEKQPIWHTSDLTKSIVCSFIIGFLIGLMF